MALYGFENTQLVAKVNDVNPQGAKALYDATAHAEETLNRNVKFGCILGAVDNKAMVGLTPPGQNVSQLGQPGVQAMGGSRPPPARCTKCGNKNHNTPDCRYPGRVCFYCKQSDHQLSECPVRPKPGTNRQTASAKPTATPQI